MNNRRLYFCHSYAPEDRPFNEHLWRLFFNEGFYSWIDTGRDKGWSGPPRPMEVSFNEWMMSRCDGFAAIIPKRESPYQRLEYRLAERMGLPRFVALQQGGKFGATATIELPTSWSLFWQHEKQEKLTESIKNFAKRVEDQASANGVLGSVGRWRPRAISNELRIALLRPRAQDLDWLQLQDMLQAESAVRWSSISPGDLRSETELISTAWTNDFDILVLDVGPSGTPRELLGYLHALGMPQIRVCRVSGDEEKELSRHLAPGQAGQIRRPYEQRDPRATGSDSLPRFLDGLKLDAAMEPVIFWHEPEDLAPKIQATVNRIEAFRSQLSPDEGGNAVVVSTQQAARHYFAQRYQQTERAYVFLSFAGSGAAAQVPDRLASILRFLNCRCFHYRDREDSDETTRLETGEYVEDGLKRRLEDTDIAVLLIDEKYLESKYCMDELKRAVERHNLRSLSLFAYKVDGKLKNPAELKDMNVWDFRELPWSSSEIEQKIIGDIQESLSALRRPLSDEERRKVLDWLQEDGAKDPSRVMELLRQSGVPEQELTPLGLDSVNSDSFLVLREDRRRHQRTRELIALLVLAVAAGRPDRLKETSGWLWRLVGWSAPPAIPAGEVTNVGEKPAILGTVEAAKAVEIGQQLGREIPEILAGHGPLCLDASQEALMLPIEWARESAESEPVALRRQIRWRLPGVKTRGCVHQLVSSRQAPPTVLALALAGADIEPTTETRQIVALLRDRYKDMGWPPEFIRAFECEDRKDLESRLNGCRDHVVHIAGHLGPDGLQVGGEMLKAETLAARLNESEARLIVLNGCDGGTVKSPLAVEYLTLADRLVHDGRVPEVVAHRAKIAVSDSLVFARAFYQTFFGKASSFDVAQAVFEARKAGSARLQLCPVVISQR